MKLFKSTTRWAVNYVPPWVSDIQSHYDAWLISKGSRCVKFLQTLLILVASTMLRCFTPQPNMIITRHIGTAAAIVRVTKEQCPTVWV